ncbi:MAG: PRC-barrel domain-containing protein [Alphaproteobacteria bacterium]|nr:PRC-barrel domain-containing protein [Alphaproteobacteria bacterium]
MRTQLAAATAAVALLAGTSAMALDPSFDPVLSTSNSNQNTTSNSNLPLQSRPGGVSSGERANDSGEGMPPHSLGLPAERYGYPAGYNTPTYYPAPAYYPTYTYPAPAYVAPTYVAPGYVAPAVYGTPVYGTPVYGTTVVTPAPAPIPATTNLIGYEVVDVQGVRLGTISNLELLSDRQTYAMVFLDPAFGSRTVAVAMSRMQYSTPGRLLVTATAADIQATPTWR